MYDILEGRSEAEKVLFNDPSPETGFLIIPDMKWDLVNTANLYLQCIVRSPSIGCLRDLRSSHLPMLTNIRSAAHKVVMDGWKLGPGSIRMFIHYHPSYCEHARDKHICMLMGSAL